MPSELPVIVDAAGPEPLLSWVQANRQWLREELTAHGALLLRGFNVSAPAEFQQAIADFSGVMPLDYAERSSHRQHVLDGVYTSTEYPPERGIFLHNEQSYNLRFPRFIAFCCFQPASSGGQTPLADTRRVLHRIDPSIREKLGSIGYKYVRHFGSRAGMTWQHAFNVADADALEAYCAANDLVCEWLERRGAPGLRTEQIRPVIARHPQSGEPVWFNHLTFFHRSTLDADLRELLAHVCGPTRFPHETLAGDDSPFDDATVAALRSAYVAEERVFDWRRNDVLLLDNMLVAHGRRPFTGERRVLVAMTQLCAWSDVAERAAAPRAADVMDWGALA